MENKLLLVVLSTFIVIFTSILPILIYYIYYIFKTISLIKKLEKQYNSVCIYVGDIKHNLINKIVMLVLENVISINDNNKFRSILQKHKNKNVMILLQSTGGYISSSDSMLNLLDNHKYKKTVYVPSYAMSAATLLCLSCDEIYMNSYAVLGATDPQISLYNDMISYWSLLKLFENKDIKDISDETVITYYENKKLYYDNINITRKYIEKHKKQNVNDADIESLIDKLTIGYIPHHIEICCESLTENLNIKDYIPNEIRLLNEYLIKLLN